MQLYPSSALSQLEFDKVTCLLREYCQCEDARRRVDELIFHTQISYLKPELQQTHEYKQLLQSGVHFPNDEILNLKGELRMLGIAGAVLKEDQCMLIRRLAESIESIFRWFDAERKIQFEALAGIIGSTHYEKNIIRHIDAVLDEDGQVRDHATTELSKIRQQLYKKRNELRRVFDRILQKLQRQGYLADIEESFLNGRRVVAIFAENKRITRGILHGESDTRKTAFIEPEETIGINNEVYALENEERREIHKILRTLTRQLSGYLPLLEAYHQVLGHYDFVRAKARLAVEMGGNYPNVQQNAGFRLIEAAHPLLLLYNRKNGKPTIPVTLALDEARHILIISGPNAGGKTVTLKTVGLLQLMLQAGLLVPVNPSSEMGIFKQIMIHIGDTQSLEFELSTYSAHLQDMKYFMEQANGRTLFFIDELGSGSDPSLGGAFAEVILEEMARKHAFGIVTTHYLNLKVMAGKVRGIINGAMGFDEQALKPLYQLMVGKPGSSYTFSIAQRIGMPSRLTEKARRLVDEGHFRLDNLLNKAEQDLRRVEENEKELARQVRRNEQLQQEYEGLIDREKKDQQLEFLKLQNQIAEDELKYLKDMERKLRQIVQEWKRTEDKEKVIKQVEALLFKKKEKKANRRIHKKIQDKYVESREMLKAGALVKMKSNGQVGQLKELRDKRAIVQLGNLPINVLVEELVVVKERPADPPPR